MFTFFYYLFEDIERLLDLVPSSARGIIFQEELTPTTSIPHLQGFVRFARGKDFSSVKRLLSGSDISTHIHIGIVTRTPEKVVQYCKKDESRFGETYEAGDLSFQQGKSNELTEAVRMIQEGHKLIEVAAEFPTSFVLHERGLRALGTLMRSADTPVRKELKCVLLYGKSGAGKTRACFEALDSIYVLDKIQEGGIWFDGYDSHRVLIIDDFYGWMPYATLLRLLDVYPIRLPIKGGFAHADYEYVVLTSNYHPAEWYREWGLTDALFRRIHSSLHVTAGMPLDTLIAFLRGELSTPRLPRITCDCCRKPVPGGFGAESSNFRSTSTGFRGSLRV